MAEVTNWEDVENALIDLSGKQPRIKDDEHIHRCPFCDKEDHFYVNYKKGVYNCYRCGGDSEDGRGSIFKLAELLGVTVETDEPEMDRDIFDPAVGQNLSDVYIAGTGIIEQTPLYERNEVPVEPPGRFQYITLENWYSPDVQAAVRYLASRGITGEHLCHYRLGLCTGSYGHPTEVVFTDFNRCGQLRWWQRRAIVDDPARNHRPKYIGPKGDKAGKIGNWYQALQQPVDYIGVAEGPVSGIIAGREFVWLWGKEHSREQLETLVSSGKRIVVAMDGEAKAFRNAIGLATELRDRGVEALIVPMPEDQDPASLGAAAFREVLDETLERCDTSDLDFLERVVRDYV